MAVWRYTIYLGDVFHNNDLTFEQRRDAICDRIKSSRWYADKGGPDSMLDDAIDQLRETTHVEEFDAVWDDIYDIANEDRAWIDTVSKMGGWN